MDVALSVSSDDAALIVSSDILQDEALAPAVTFITAVSIAAPSPTYK